MALVKLAGFDERVRRHAWTGNTLPAVYHGPRQCRCGTTLVPLDPVTADPLFLHAGYGEAIRTTAAFCPGCHHLTVLRRETVRPRIPLMSVRPN